MNNCYQSLLSRKLLSVILLLPMGCGGETESGTNSSTKTPAMANGFLVDMVLEPAPDGRCPNGGVTQRYFSDLNANGILDQGEDSGHVKLYDCYMGARNSTNPCQPGDFCTRINLGSDQVVSCETASESALATVNFIAQMNDWATDFDKLIPKQRCQKTLEKGLATKDLDVYFSRDFKKTEGLDYSALTAIGPIDELTINASKTAIIPSENMAAMRKIPRTHSIELQNFDFSDHDITNILPTAGSNFIYLQGINRTNLAGFSHWVYSTKTVIKSIVDSTIIETSGPSP